jgi:hypothetical protein
MRTKTKEKISRKDAKAPGSGNSDDIFHSAPLRLGEKIFPRLVLSDMFKLDA